MTGVSPGKHGVFDFFKYKIVSENKWVTELVTTYELENPRIHETIGLLEGKTRMFLLNIISGYPLLPVRNAEILQIDFFVPRLLSSPPSLIERYRDYIKAIDEIDFYRSFECGAIDRGSRLLEAYREIIEDSLSEAYDFYWFAIPFPDAVLHKCYKVARELSMLGKIYIGIDKIMTILLQILET